MTYLVQLVPIEQIRPMPMYQRASASKYQLLNRVRHWRLYSQRKSIIPPVLKAQYLDIGVICLGLSLTPQQETILGVEAFLTVRGREVSTALALKDGSQTYLMLAMAKRRMRVHIWGGVRGREHDDKVIRRELTAPY